VRTVAFLMVLRLTEEIFRLQNQVVGTQILLDNILICISGFGFSILNWGVSQFECSLHLAFITV